MAEKIFQELIYTSAPKGLKPFSTGFCTVAHTTGMPINIIDYLEKQSVYRTAIALGSDDSHNNPVSFIHYKYKNGDENYHLLSRICFPGFDYSGRSNKLAHHILISERDLTGAPSLLGGPAVFLDDENKLFEKTWASEPKYFPGKPIPQRLEYNPGISLKEWEATTGDKGWAGQLLDLLINKKDRPTYLIYNNGTNVLKLIQEALSLLDEEERWKITFNTYTVKSQISLDECLLRCCLKEAPELKLLRDSEINKMDLTCISGATLLDTDFVKYARSEKFIYLESEKRPTDNERANTMPNDNPVTYSRLNLNFSQSVQEPPSLNSQPTHSKLNNQSAQLNPTNAGLPSGNTLRIIIAVIIALILIVLIALIVKPFSNKSKSPSTGGTSSKLSTADGIEIINNGSPQNGTPVAPLPTKTDTDQKNSNTTAVLLSKNETMPIQTELVKSAGPTKEDSKQAILPEKSQEQKTPGKPQTEEVAATPAKPKEDNPVKKTEPSPPAGEDKENNTYYNKLKNINASLEKVKSDFSKLEKDFSEQSDKADKAKTHNSIIELEDILKKASEEHEGEYFKKLKDNAGELYTGNDKFNEEFKNEMVKCLKEIGNIDKDIKESGEKISFLEKCKKIEELKNTWKQLNDEIIKQKDKDKKKIQDLRDREKEVDKIEKERMEFSGTVENMGELKKDEKKNNDIINKAIDKALDKKINEIKIKIQDKQKIMTSKTENLNTLKGYKTGIDEVKNKNDTYKKEIEGKEKSIGNHYNLIKNNHASQVEKDTKITNNFPEEWKKVIEWERATVNKTQADKEIKIELPSSAMKDSEISIRFINETSINGKNECKIRYKTFIKNDVGGTPKEKDLFSISLTKIDNRTYLTITFLPDATEYSNPKNVNTPLFKLEDIKSIKIGDAEFLPHSRAK